MDEVIKTLEDKIKDLKVHLKAWKKVDDAFKKDKSNNVLAEQMVVYYKKKIEDFRKAIGILLKY